MLKKISALSLLLIAIFGGCDSMRHTRCNDTILSREKSPDSRFVAILYRRSCANNTGLYTWVGLQEVSTTMADTEIEPILTIAGTHDITAVWKNATNLAVDSEGLRNHKAVMTQKDAWKQITISYGN